MNTYYTPAPPLQHHDWINFAWLHCPSCSRVRVASCREKSGLACVPIVRDSGTKCLQCSDVKCDKCYKPPPSNILCADCTTGKPLVVEIFRAQIAEISYLNQVWQEDLPNTILHSMLYCPNCRAVGFPGSEQHLTVHGGSKGQELTFTNPDSAGKLGKPDHWRLVHTPLCQSTRSKFGGRQENEATNIPALFTIKIDKAEAAKFQELVQSTNVLSVSEASLCAMELSRARFYRRQEHLEMGWNDLLKQLVGYQHPSQETSSSSSSSSKTQELIDILSSLRKLVVVGGYAVLDKFSLIEVVRRVQQEQGEAVYDWKVASCFGRLLRAIIQNERV